MTKPSKAIVLFDGHCNLCNRSVQFILLRDAGAYFQFSSLQSAKGQELLLAHGLVEPPDSIVLVENGQAYVESAAALRIARGLSWPWKILSIFLIVPAFIRNWVYRFIARNRYRWFGRTEECWLPKPEWKERFLN
jgi:predicted DCC family thiol-disulfide oxidoreductase YuxK